MCERGLERVGWDTACVEGLEHTAGGQGTQMAAGAYEVGAWGLGWQQNTSRDSTGGLKFCKPASVPDSHHTPPHCAHLSLLASPQWCISTQPHIQTELYSTGYPQLSRTHVPCLPVRVRAHLRPAVPTFVQPDHPHHPVRPAGPTGPYRPLSHSLSWTLVCFYYPSLLGTLNSP